MNRLGNAVDESPSSLSDRFVESRVHEYRSFPVRTATALRGIDEDVWINALMRRIDNTNGPIVVDDVRFPNEARRLKAAGFTLILLEISPAEQIWKIAEGRNSPLATDGLLQEARDAGFDFTANAINGMCYQEHFFPARYETYSEQVLVREASERVDVIPARYGLVEKQVMVEPEKKSTSKDQFKISTDIH